MEHRGFSAISLVAVVLVILFQESSALQCWTCSSDTSNGAYCSDYFDISTIPDKTRQYAYQHCPTPSTLSYGGKPACQKIKDRVGNRVVIRRRCAYPNPNASNDACMHEQVSASIQREFCEVCDTDGCNGAAQYGPAVLFVMVAAAITKFLSS